ncbi:MAG: hypothetical protein ACLP6G_21495 [Terriglobales bacterium]
MAKPNHQERWESGIIAAAMAVAGTLFMFDKLGSLVRSGMLSWQTALHTAPMPLVVLGVGLLLAEQGSVPRADRQSKGQ